LKTFKHSKNETRGSKMQCMDPVEKWWDAALKIGMDVLQK
jgi:hypothetical protein